MHMYAIDGISKGQAGRSAGLGKAWDEAVRDTRAGRRGRVAAKVARGSVTVAMAAAIAPNGVPAVAFADAASAGGTAKTQVVYAKASATGSQEGVYVVNQFESEDGSRAKASDAGDYESVKNLTDDQQLSASGTSAFDVSADEPFLYQGDLASSTQLPWTVKAGYKLDGKTVLAEQLAGASGKLEMTLDIQPNPECESAYADNFLLQVSGSFDNDLASSVEADGATLAQSAGNTQASYMVFPGKSGSYTINADVRDFEFGGWTIVGVPLSIARPDIHVVLMDALGKRVKFLQSVIDRLNLNAEAVHIRAEDAAKLPDYRDRFDLAVARAVAALPVLCELTLPFVKSGGRFIAYKGPSLDEELSQSGAILKRMKSECLETLPVAFPGRDWDHRLCVVRKNAPTPASFPRKAGEAGRNPILR